MDERRCFRGFHPITSPCLLWMLATAGCLGGDTQERQAGGLTDVVWSADMETGDLSQWEQGYGGGEFNSGGGDSVASDLRARSGRFAAATRIDGGSGGTRLFRWAEPRALREAYYSAWFYVPATLRIGSWYQLFQFKSRTTSNGVDPFWYVELESRADGTLGSKLTWWNGLSVEGPHAGERGGRSYRSAAVVPVARWFQLEAFLRQSTDFDGRITVWLDGEQVFDQPNVRTTYANCNYNDWCGSNEWSVNSYGEGLSPDPLTTYIDDAAITSSRQGTGDASDPAPSPDPVSDAPAVAPSSVEPPTVSGTATVGHTLTASTGTWSGTPTAFAYEWLRCRRRNGSRCRGTGVTSDRYGLDDGDVGSTIRVRVTASNDAGRAVATSPPTPRVDW